MAKALYRKYRSKALGEVIGQKHITDILEQALKVGRISHAYLFTGPRGVGKTSIARILAHEINKIPYSEDSVNLDIIEIDAASNNGVEDVRDLREKVQIAPVAASHKIYIIDEVHMLSKAAFNALLKTLEEPPEHVVFILATTNIEKLPATIISRTQRFAFRPINLDDIVKHLTHIAREENIEISEDALRLIAVRGDGSFRDSISLLDQLSSLIGDKQTKITDKLIEEVLGLAPSELIKQLVNSVETHNLDSIIKLLNDAEGNGVDSKIIVEQLLLDLKTELATKPHLLPLFDALLDVAKSPRPEMKLISVLGLAAVGKKTTKTVALATPVMEVSASVEELRQQPREHIAKTAAKPTKKTTPDLAPTPAVVAEEEPIVRGEAKPFDWNALVDHSRKNYVALYSVLSKCSHELNGDTLTLYTMNKFYKNKLDDTKYSPMIAKCLHAIGVYDVSVETIPTPPPLKDSQAAAVAAIMGGGQEVKVEI